MPPKLRPISTPRVSGLRSFGPISFCRNPFYAWGLQYDITLYCSMLCYVMLSHGDAVRRCCHHAVIFQSKMQVFRIQGLVDSPSDIDLNPRHLDSRTSPIRILRIRNLLCLAPGFPYFHSWWLFLSERHRLVFLSRDSWSRGCFVRGSAAQPLFIPGKL